MGENKSLATPPNNLKEAIDWLALVGGGFGGNGLGKYEDLEKALTKLPGFDGVKTTVFGNKSVQSSIKDLANGLGYGFLGYVGTTSIGWNGVVRTANYNSTYKDASWPEAPTELQKCALIFLGCAVAVYYCIGYLHWRLNGGGWVRQTVGGSGAYLYNLLLAMGYSANELNNAGDGITILNKVVQNLDELKKAATASNDCSKFFEQLEKIESNKALNCPLASCFKLAKEYFTEHNANEVTQAIRTLKEKFEELSKNQETSESYLSSNPYIVLSEPIQKLLSQAAKFKPNEASTTTAVVHGDGGAGQPTNQSSISGSIAGALTSIAAAGGAGAAYAFNVGGVQAILGAIFNFN
ncbi:variant erythrocyte surface antigen-1 family protein [Babesia caballi]|uniref:Variant erythrocyte surface antigen-1 family protein n=1 Tax=Babesia caballi TaxID=5871 RepID=A0AAV4LY41_BABCB|nr:variant erythrocyte surface antigen-1 family protein [Babesia caballi]